MMTSGKLIAKLLELDPSGELPIIIEEEAVRDKEGFWLQIYHMNPDYVNREWFIETENGVIYYAEEYEEGAFEGIAL